LQRLARTEDHVGASCWTYFVPYQRDVEKALQDLRAKVFKEGAYYKPDVWARHLHASGSLSQENLDNWLERLKAEPEPKTIEELLELRAEEMTHSILDIERVSDDPNDILTVSGLSRDEYMEVLGTLKPTHEQVESKQSELWDLRGRGEAVFVLVYKNGKPDEIFFAGVTGD
jgi:hypothetical protein